jgi:hypothetical protein
MQSRRRDGGEAYSTGKEKKIKRKGAVIRSPALAAVRTNRCRATTHCKVKGRRRLNPLCFWSQLREEEFKKMSPMHSEKREGSAERSGGVERKGEEKVSEQSG